MGRGWVGGGRGGWWGGVSATHRRVVRFVKEAELRSLSTCLHCAEADATRA